MLYIAYHRISRNIFRCNRVVWLGVSPHHNWINLQPFHSSGIPPTTTDIPFDLVIHGNRTSPLFDRRLSLILSDSSKLLCDFKEEFACQWGAEAGRWAIVQEGAIPSLEEDIGPDVLPPTFPAALVLQGTVMLTSDPIRCQKGPGKVWLTHFFGPKRLKRGEEKDHSHFHLCLQSPCRFFSACGRMAMSQCRSVLWGEFIPSHRKFYQKH